MTTLVRRGDKPVQRILIEQVRATHVAAEAAAVNRVSAIRLARNLGVTWEDIGDAMGMSRQAVHRRFAQLVEGPPTHPICSPPRSIA